MDVEKASVSALLDAAQMIRRGGKEDPATTFAIAKRLATLRYIEEARLLAQHLASLRLLSGASAVALAQKWALWTSQNPDAPDDSKHDDALSILEQDMPEGSRLSQSKDPETLGIAGGICKRMWLADGQRSTLERSLAWYERGAKAGVEADNGYTAINAAFVLDLLASDEGPDGDDRRVRARALRQQVRNELPPLADTPAGPGGPLRRTQSFFWETIAEAHFGLGEYAPATDALKTAYQVRQPEPWELETTARQFAWLARMQDPQVQTSEDFERSQAWGVLRAVYGDSTTAGAGSLFAGKLGLSLSGGGFRSSLFHIGVLAALAERDLLRHVEVLSCVSGGSILGAHYYLEVRQLLQSKADGEITRQDYIDLVERVARDFLDGVQKNIRVRIATSLLANLRMLFQPGYTTTTRLAELYEEHLYDRVADDKQRELRHLMIRPKGDENVVPKYDNWRRVNKVPILILNATSLNTGHNWQFTTSWMGEPPSAIESRVDGNYRLRRMYIDREAPAHKNIHIGEAAAASACVPGLFTPLELRGLYPGITVRLVDGGVHDNQGQFGLLEQNCSVMIVSDACGQMSTDDVPADGPVGVLLRTVSLLQARVRVACFREIESRRKSGRLKGLLFLHLKRGLEVEARDWIHSSNPKVLSIEELLRTRAALTDFRVIKWVQALLAGIRTDLDSFSDLEAFALMTSGCNMVRATVDEAITGFATDRREHDWPFLHLAEAMKDEARSERELKPLLAAGAVGMFRMFMLSPVLKGFSYALAACGAAGLAYALWQWHAEPLLSLRGLAAAAAMVALTLVAGRLGLGLILKVVNYPKTLHQIGLGAALAVVGWLAMSLHLKSLDPWFLRLGAKRNDRNRVG